MATLLQLVLEYLRFEGFTTTAETLEDEKATTASSGETSASASLHKAGESRRDAIVQDFLTLFDEGDLHGTFSLWHSQLPKDALDDPDAAKLQFYLHIYFAIYPLHGVSGGNPAKKEKAAHSMKEFRTFLETQGVQLAQTPEFLPYYALPFVPDPSVHPSFKGMFQNEWVDDLRHQLHEFLEERIAVPPLPQLVQMFENKAHLDEASALPSESAERANRVVSSATDFVKYQASLLSRLDVLSRRRSPIPLDLLSEARKEFKKFTEVLSDVSSCSNVDMAEAMLRQSLPKLRSRPSSPDGCNANADLPVRRAWTPPEHSRTRDDQSPGLSPNRRLSRSSSPSIRPSADGDAIVSLDFAKVKNDLGSLSSEHMCVLLQALRWRLGKTRCGRHRCAVMQQFIDHDLLDCNTEVNRSLTVPAGGDLLASLLRSDDSMLRESCVRFINTIATDSIGRTYLLNHRRLIPLLCMTLTLEKTDSSVHQNALGALQKFSLRRQPQSEMIGLGMVEYLVRILSDVEGLSEYSTEYGTALLMNLSLRTMGKQRAEKSPVDILSVLNHLLEHENPQVRTYINGTLYSVLTRPALKERAREMGLGAMLSYLMECCNEQYRRQIAYILQQLNSEADDQEDEGQSDHNDGNPDEGDSDFEDEEEMEDFEEEDEDELADRNTSGLRGEELLNSEYTAESCKENASRTLRNSVVAKPIRQSSGRSGLLGGSLAKAIKAMPPQRPVTPHIPHSDSSRAPLSRTRSELNFPNLQKHSDSRSDVQLNLRHHG